MPDIARVMPNNNDAEQALLCSILIDNEKAPIILLGLNENCFYSRAHKIIFNAMHELNKKNAPTDFISVCDYLEKSGDIDKIGGVAYLSELTNILPSSANWAYYNEIVYRDTVLRSLISMGTDIIEKCYSADVDGGAAMSYAQSRLLDLYKKLGGESLVHISKGLDSVMKRINDILANKPITGVRTGFPNLDKIIGMYQPGQMIVLAARPGCGKTSFAMNIVANIATQNKEKVIAVFNLEMGAVELVQRFLLSEAEVPYSKIVDEKNNTTHIARLWEKKRDIEMSHIFIDESSDTTPQGMMAKLKELKTKTGRLDFVVIDYLQLMATGDSSRDNYQVQVARISRALKLMAKELEVPIMVLSQTSRDLERRSMNPKEDKTPKMSDLRDSGAIEQDADQIYFLTKEDKAEGENFDRIDLHIVKNRSGQTDKRISFKWQGDIVKFSPITERIYSSETKEVKEVVADENDSIEPPISGVISQDEPVILSGDIDWKAEKESITANADFTPVGVDDDSDEE